MNNLEITMIINLCTTFYKKGWRAKLPTEHQRHRLPTRKRTAPIVGNHARSYMIFP